MAWGADLAASLGGKAGNQKEDTLVSGQHVTVRCINKNTVYASKKCTVLIAKKGTTGIHFKAACLLVFFLVV